MKFFWARHRLRKYIATYKPSWTLALNTLTNSFLKKQILPSLIVVAWDFVKKIDR